MISCVGNFFGGGNQTVRFALWVIHRIVPPEHFSVIKPPFDELQKGNKKKK